VLGFKHDLDALLVKFKAAPAVKATAEANNGMYTYDAFTSLITHHLHDMLFHAMQEINTTVYNYIVGLYVQYSDEVYSNRVQNINNELSFDKALRLCATSHVIITTVQNTCVDCLLCVLFDSGADKTMMKRLALPRGVNPLLGRKRCVIGVTSSALLDKEVLIKDMILPEFSSTTCILGPICAIIMDNSESSYDLIVSMDLMQTLGIYIHNSSKTVVWDQLQVPFKPHDYFSSNLFQTALQEQMVSSFNEHNADEELGYKSQNIKGSLYEQHDPHHVAKQHTHLSPQLLVRFPKLFSGNWDVFPTCKFTLNSKQTLCHSAVVHTQYLSIMSKSSKTNFNFYVTLECSNDVVHPSGYCPSSS
jgi:hypothetical protein